MPEAFTFYSITRTDAKYDLAVVLNRAAVRLFWSFYDEAYISESRYVARYSAFGATAEDSLHRYGANIQEPRNWLAVAHEYLQEVAGFDVTLAELTDDEIESPGMFWDFVIKPLFIQAYEEPIRCDAIARIYAYADWCHFQDHSGLEDCYHLPTTALTNFYEWMPTIPKALIDMPNWFTFDEIEYWLLNSPFMENSREDILRVFGRPHRT